MQVMPCPRGHPLHVYNVSRATLFVSWLVRLEQVAQSLRQPPNDNARPLAASFVATSHFTPRRPPPPSPDAPTAPPPLPHRLTLPPFF